MSSVSSRFYSTYEELKPMMFFTNQKYFIICFYSTYEELKLAANIVAATIFVASFYSTYEELKLGFQRQCPSMYLSFYSTYEELKLRQAMKEKTYASLVFTVPMRNWNSKL